MEVRNVFVVLVSKMGTSLVSGVYDYGEVYIDEKRAAARRDALRDKLARVCQADNRPFKGEVRLISSYLLF